MQSVTECLFRNGYSGGGCACGNRLQMTDQPAHVSFVAILVWGNLGAAERHSLSIYFTRKFTLFFMLQLKLELDCRPAVVDPL